MYFDLIFFSNTSAQPLLRLRHDSANSTSSGESGTPIDPEDDPNFDQHSNIFVKVSILHDFSKWLFRFL